MSDLVQGDRPIGVETPLGQDVLVLTSFAGEERISGLFSFELQLMSDRGDIKPDEIVADFDLEEGDEGTLESDVRLDQVVRWAGRPPALLL